MLFNNPLDYILGQQSKVKILRFLVKSSAELNGREIAKAVGLSHVKCHTALRELSVHGLINMRRIGRSVLYSIEPENILVKFFLTPLYNKESDLVNILAKTIAKEFSPPKPVAIFLFGSIIKGQPRPNSDIDILLVQPDEKNMRQAKEELSKAERNAVKLFGNRLAPIMIKESKFKKKYKREEKLVKEVVKTGKIIYGKSLPELLRDEK